MEVRSSLFFAGDYLGPIAFRDNTCSGSDLSSYQIPVHSQKAQLFCEASIEKTSDPQLVPKVRFPKWMGKRFQDAPVILHTFKSYDIRNLIKIGLQKFTGTIEIKTKTKPWCFNKTLNGKNKQTKTVRAELGLILLKSSNCH